MKNYSYPLCEEGAVQASGTSVQLRGPNPKRTNLIITAPSSGRITIQLRGPAVLDQGLTLYAGGNPLYLSCENVGHAIKEEISVASSNPGTWVGFLDVFTSQDQE